MESVDVNSFLLSFRIYGSHWLCHSLFSPANCTCTHYVRERQESNSNAVRKSPLPFASGESIDPDKDKQAKREISNRAPILVSAPSRLQRHPTSTKCKANQSIPNPVTQSFSSCPHQCQERSDVVAESKARCSRSSWRGLEIGVEETRQQSSLGHRT